MHVYREVWKLLLQLDNKEQFQNNIKTIKREIYEACGFRAVKSQYNTIIQELSPEGVRFTLKKEYITLKKEYIPNYL